MSVVRSIISGFFFFSPPRIFFPVFPYRSIEYRRRPQLQKSVIVGPDRGAAPPPVTFDLTFRALAVPDKKIERTYVTVLPIGPRRYMFPTADCLSVLILYLSYVRFLFVSALSALFSFFFFFYRFIHARVFRLSSRYVQLSTISSPTVSLVSSGKRFHSKEK